MKNKQQPSLAIDPAEDYKAEIINECVKNLDAYTASGDPHSIKQWRADVRAIIADTVNAAWSKDFLWRYHNDAKFNQFVQRMVAEALAAKEKR